MRSVPLLLLLAFAPVVLASSFSVDKIEAKITDGSIDPARDLAPMLDRLAASRSDDERNHIIDAIVDFGEYDGTRPADVKHYLREFAPRSLLAVARSKAGWSTRGDALMALRSLNASDAVLDEAAVIAASETGEYADYIRSRGELLIDWKQSRSRVGVSNIVTSAVDPLSEQEALEFLRLQKERVSGDNLGSAALRARTEIVEALLDAGIDVNVSLAAGRPIDYAATGCGDREDNPTARAAVIDLLIRRGADLRYRNKTGNTVLMGAVQNCTVAVAQQLVQAGADPDPINALGTSPLQMAFIMGKWDVAELLVAHGARIDDKTLDRIFFEKPSDPARLDLIRRATTK